MLTKDETKPNQEEKKQQNNLVKSSTNYCQSMHFYSIQHPCGIFGDFCITILVHIYINNII